MIRHILTILLPLVAPTVLYFIWINIRQRRKEHREAGEPVPAWQTWPWPILAGIGSVLAIISLLLTGLIGVDDSKEKKYIAPHMEDGELVPGQFIEKD